MLHLHSPEASETVRTGRNIDLFAVLGETTSHPRQIFQNIFTKGITIKTIIISNLTHFSNAHWPVSSCAKQKCSSVLTIHMSKHMQFFHKLFRL